MAYASGLEIENLQKVSFDPSTETIVGEPEWITRGLEPQIMWPNLSPDGERLAFIMGANRASPDVGVMRTDRTGRRNLTNDPYRNFGPAWSPDGQRLAFYGNRSGNHQLWLIEPDGSGLQQLTDMPSMVILPVWSPDGSLIVGSLSDDQGLPHPYIFSSKGMDDRPPEALPQVGEEGTGLETYSWSSDGKKLAGELYGSARGIAIFSFATREWKKLIDFGRAPRWLSDNRRLLFVNQGRLFLLDSVFRSYHEVLSVAPDRIGGDGFALSKDDRVIYFARLSVESDIWLLTLDEDR